MGEVTQRIQQKIIDNLRPIALEIINESAKHHGHAGDDGSGESHFKLKIVSELFQGKSRLERQRMIYAILKDEMSMIHALSLELKEDVKN